MHDDAWLIKSLHIKIVSLQWHLFLKKIRKKYNIVM
jgi:hypothetical protein